MSKFGIAVFRPAALVIGSLALILAGTAKADIAAMQQPTPGTGLASTSVIFRWSTGTNVLQYYLYVGSSLGGNDIYSASQGTNTSGAVNHIPEDGRIVYVRLWSLVGDINNGWQFNDYRYQTAVPTGGAGTTTLTSSADRSAVCQLVTLTAAVTPANATGTVTFFDGSATLGTFSLSGGSASFSTSAFTTGYHQLLASYNGDASNSRSAGSLIQTVSGSVTVTLSSSPNPSTVNQGVTMTATVAAPACQAAPS
ncbi:MAG TPA: Ig-like domain-containing protein, partial [Bryobacteraceae bacterium]|nr:Ig-like domain-containing protein [Bryobacteraceae bacterium]